MFLKLDAEGPTAVAANLGDKKSTCTMKMGMTYSSFLNDCVTVLNDSQKNKLATNKLLGNMQHTSENFIFDVAGVNLDFSSEAIGQFDLFGGDTAQAERFTVAVPDVAEWDKQVKLGYEREMLGLYVSDHPLMGIEHVLSRAVDRSVASLADSEECPSGTVVTIGGLITGLQRKVTRRGDTWAIATVEDLWGAF